MEKLYTATATAEGGSHFIGRLKAIRVLTPSL